MTKSNKCKLCNKPSLVYPYHKRCYFIKYGNYPKIIDLSFIDVLLGKQVQCIRRKLGLA